MNRSVRLWFEPRPTVLLSDGTRPAKDVYACPTSVQILVCDDEQEAATLCTELNDAALRALGS